MFFINSKKELEHKERVIEDLTKDRNQLRTALLDSMQQYSELQEECLGYCKQIEQGVKEHLETLEELGKDKDRILYLLTTISNMRQEWIREHSEEFEDGTDIVTPFDHIFYSMRD